MYLYPTEIDFSKAEECNDSDYFIQKKSSLPLDQYNLKKYLFFDSSNHQTYLTNREYQCLSLWIQGKTTKTIARQMSISNRTVDSYMACLKLKLRCQYSWQLFEVARNNEAMGWAYFNKDQLWYKS